MLYAGRVSAQWPTKVQRESGAHIAEEQSILLEHSSLPFTIHLPCRLVRGSLLRSCPLSR
jgi:hypothetical protein